MLRPQSRFPTFVIVTLILIIASVVGCIGGYGVYAINLTEPNGWIAFERPPTEIEQLIDAEFATVYVRTEDNRMFACYRASQYDVDCWQEITTVPDQYPASNCNSTVFWSIPRPPANVTDRVAFEYCHRFGATTYRYVLTADGTVWQWRSDDFTWIGPPQQFRRLLLSTCGGGILGLIGGIIIAAIVVRRRNNV